VLQRALLPSLPADLLDKLTHMVGNKVSKPIFAIENDLKKKKSSIYKAWEGGNVAFFNLKTSRCKGLWEPNSYRNQWIC